MLPRLKTYGGKKQGNCNSRFGEDANERTNSGYRLLVESMRYKDADAVMVGIIAGRSEGRGRLGVRIRSVLRFIAPSLR